MLVHRYGQMRNPLVLTIRGKKPALASCVYNAQDTKLRRVADNERVICRPRFSQVGNVIDCRSLLQK